MAFPTERKRSIKIEMETTERIKSTKTMVTPVEPLDKSKSITVCLSTVWVAATTALESMACRRIICT
jgi:hypothetical protein